jgi:glycosyltransferase involved in cell wall biosynthesis
MKLSLCMIVKDERYFIEDCLSQAAPHVDELVIVDTGSTDGTVEIAGRFSESIHSYQWNHNFADARNFGLERATGDWILVLDADERIAQADYHRLRAAMDTTKWDGYYLTTRNYTSDGRRQGAEVSPVDDDMARGFPYYYTHPIMKLFRRNGHIRYDGRIHEVVDASVGESRRGTLDIVIHHYGEANPDRPKATRALRYLSMMDEELPKSGDGRLYSIAGSTAMSYANDYSKAYAYFSRAAELGYEPQASMEGAAEAAYRSGDIGVARDLYFSLYEDGYRTAALCLNYANLMVKAGNKPEAAALLEECLELGGLDAETNAIIKRNIDYLRAQ